MRNDANGRWRRRAAPRWALAVLAAGALGACDGLLDVEDPDVATPGSVETEAALPVVLAGAVGDFQVALAGTGGASNGNSEGVLNLSGIFTDEFQYASTFPTRLEIDRRAIQTNNSTADLMFRNLQRARAAASRSARLHLRFRPSSSGTVESYALEGMAYVLMGETYCNGVPISTLTGTGGTEYGAPQSNVQLFEAAVVRFDSALSFGAGASASVVDLARVGKARALLDLNRPADAAAAVAGVPTGFTYLVRGSENTARQNNGTFALQNLGRRVTVTDVEGGNGLPYRTDADPRVQQVRGTGTSASSDQGIPLWLQQKYASRTANVVVASGVEARLIEAEARLRAGDVDGFIGKLNEARGTLPALTDPGTPAARVDLLFRERAYALWLTAHRLGDLRRQVRQYERGAETVFPTGGYYRGGAYGPDVNFPVPVTEENNPNFTGCTDRNA